MRTSGLLSCLAVAPSLIAAAEPVPPELFERCANHILNVFRLKPKFNGAAFNASHVKQIAHETVKAICFTARVLNQGAPRGLLERTIILIQ